MSNGFAPVWVVHSAVLWIPSVGEEFEGRLRHGDTWYRIRWHGWSKVNPAHAIIEALEPGPRPYDVLTGTRPVPLVR